MKNKLDILATKLESVLSVIDKKTTDQEDKKKINISKNDELFENIFRKVSPGERR